MTFRPFSRLFLERTYETFVEDRNSGLNTKKRSQSQRIPPKIFPLQALGHTTGLWNTQLAQMQHKVMLQRAEIKLKDAEFKDNLETGKRLRELRGVVLKRKNHVIALQYRYLGKGRTVRQPSLFTDQISLSPDPLFRLTQSPTEVIRRKRSVTPRLEYRKQL